MGKHPASAGAWRWWWRVASPQRAPCPPPQPSHEEEGTSPRWTSPLWAALGKSQPLSGPCRLGGLGFQTPLPLRPLLLSSFGGGAERGRREAWAPSSHAPSAPGSQCRVHGSVPQYLLLSLGTLSPTTLPPRHSWCQPSEMTPAVWGEGERWPGMTRGGAGSSEEMLLPLHREWDQKQGATQGK